MRVQDAKSRRYGRRPLPPPSEDDLRWQRFKAELADRIAAIRLEEADERCPTCGSTDVAGGTQKRCRTCERVLPADCFYRDRQNADGLQYVCKECTSVRVRAQMKERRKREALAAIRRTA